jgi:Cof subfamily protein (haloacid dehalogenase superfamily)
MIALIAIDLDDTLLKEDLTLSAKNKEALKKAHEKGIHIVLCSGRPYAGMIKYVEELGFFNKEDYIISYNGALVNNFDNEILFRQVIGHEEILKLIAIGKKHQIDIQLYNDDTYIIGEETDYSRSYQQLSGLAPIFMEDLTQVTESVKILFNGPADERLEHLRLEIIETFGDSLNVFYSKPNYIEVLNPLANKGLAVKYLTEYLNLKQDQVMAIGDSYNDLSMIEYAGLGIVVANGREDVKKAAQYVTAASHEQDAVAEAILLYALSDGCEDEDLK